jgi:hypothetical protein
MTPTRIVLIVAIALPLSSQLPSIPLAEHEPTAVGATSFAGPGITRITSGNDTGIGPGKSVAMPADVYFNDFNGPVGTTYPEWTCSGYKNSANQAGTVAAGRGPQAVSTVESPNGKQRFLGEFGGPALVTAPPYDPKHFVRVDETVTLTLGNLRPHASATVTFELYVLKSWDGNNSNYGPDRWSLSVPGGPTLLDTTFSNNPKTGDYNLSLQDYPAANSPHQSGAAAVNTLGYKFYGDSIYHLTYTFTHSGDTLILNFSSSLFEGKGIEDESWGVDNVRVGISSP